MFYRRAAIGRGHCVQKERPRVQIDNRCAKNPLGTNLSAANGACRYRRADISLPNDRTIDSVQRVNVIGFGHSNDHRPAVWTTFNIQRLCVNISDNTAIEARVACQVRGGRGCEGRINVKAIT